MANARKIAVKALIEIEKSEGYSNIVLKNIFSNNDMSPKDKSLASAIIYGTLDRRLTIDFVLKKFIKKPLSKIDPVTYEALSIAVFQIMYMDKIPESAAVNESVNIVKSSKERYNSSFVNAVLRSFLRERVELPQGDDAASISVRYSCPQWIVDSFLKDYGIENTISILEESLKKPPVTLRVNTTKISAEQLKETLIAENIETEIISDTSLKVISSIDVQNSKAYSSGYFHVQDLASQYSIEKLALKPYERVLDLCSAPGGKSFTMAEIMGNKGEILAFDLYPQRAELISKGANRLGIVIIKADAHDATVFDENLGKFDAVLCDVPCSGFGVIRRKPEIKYKKQCDFSELNEIQLMILENAARYTTEKGRILYSTCTLRKAENEAVTKAFLDKHTDYELKYQHTYMPHIDGTDGFYCALLVKSR